MTLHPPFSISSRLLPALTVAGATLSLDKGEVFILDLPDGSEHRIDDFRPGAGDISDWFASILCFLGAAAESRHYREHVKRESEIDPDSNETLFVPAIVDWASQNYEEIQLMEMDIMNTDGVLITD